MYVGGLSTGTFLETKSDFAIGECLSLLSVLGKHDHTAASSQKDRTGVGQYVTWEIGVFDLRLQDTMTPL